MWQNFVDDHIAKRAGGVDIRRAGRTSGKGADVPGARVAFTIAGIGQGEGVARASGRDLSGRPLGADGLADGADLFLTECTGFHPAAGGHLDYLTLANRRAELHARRIVLVHVGEELLRNRRKVRLPIARDGQTFLV